MSLTILDVAERQLCCGCGLCAAVEPAQFRMDDVPGHGLRPITDGPVRDTPGHRLAVETCPGLNLRHESGRAGAEDIDELYEVWGPCEAIYEGYATDDAVRRRGSSGGVATALGVYGIEAGDAGGVLHIAAADDKPLVNKSVISRTPEELLERTGSRYAPASPLEGLGRLADESQPVVFIGKPCDVAGVTQLCRARPDVDEKVALTIGIFCAGTPSSTGTRKLLAKMGVKDPDAVTSMRYRGNGWPGMIVVTERLPDGTEARYEITYAEGWALLSKYRQWRCLICPDHVGEFADVAVGDPWYREIGPDEPGQSLILARTPRGRAFVERAIAAGAIVAEEVEPRLMRAAQEHLYRTRVAMWGRLLAMRLFGLPTPRFVNMRVWSNWLWLAGAKEKLISVAGTLRRLKRKGLLGPVRVVAESVATPFNRSRRTTADAATDQATEADGAIETSAPGANGVVSRH